MRSIWSGAIGFGLVNIPVKIYSATVSHTLDLDMLDKKDHSNIRYKRVNEETGREVPWENIVKGYWVNGRYVVLEEKDFERAAVTNTKTIVINEFVEEGDVDSVYYETPYYLVPDKTGARAYNLLLEALSRSGKVGVATFVMRNREHLALLKPEGDVIVLIQIRFADEIRDPADLDMPKRVAIKPAELKMAMALIDQLTGEFDISEFKDTYKDELLKLIRAKAKGKPLKAPPPKTVHTKTKDLMAELKASIEGRRRRA